MATSPEKWEGVKTLFDAALEVDPSARSAFLRDNSPDAETRAEVERLLKEHDQAGGFLSAPVLGNFPLDAEAPTQTNAHTAVPTDGRVALSVEPADARQAIRRPATAGTDTATLVGHE